MHIVKTWCENTKEGRSYLKYNNYCPILRVGKYWLTRNVGSNLADVKVII